MSEQSPEKNEVVEGAQPEVKQEEVTLSPIEQEAVEEGWIPKHEWVAAGNKEEEWRPARDFKERGELFRRIDQLTTDLKTTRSTLGALKGHYEKVKESEFQRAYETLKQEKRQALEQGDAGAVVDIDEKIAEIKETQKQQAAETTVPQEQQVHPDFTSWVSKNSWYTSNTEMQNFADSIGRAYALSKPGVAPNDVLKYVSTKVKQAFPEKFENPKRTEPSPVEGSKGTRTTSKSESYELSVDEERVMNKLVRQGAITKEDYIRDLKQIKGQK